MSNDEEHAQPTYMKTLLTQIQSKAEQVGQEEGVTFTPGGIAALATLISLLGDTVSADIKEFAAHAKRQHVNRDDVLLLARRNETLKEYMSKTGGKRKKKSDSASTKRKKEAT